MKWSSAATPEHARAPGTPVCSTRTRASPVERVSARPAPDASNTASITSSAASSRSTAGPVAWAVDAASRPVRSASISCRRSSNCKESSMPQLEEQILEEQLAAAPVWDPVLAANPYQPYMARIVRIYRMVKDNWVFTLRFLDDHRANTFAHRPGQFVMLSLPGTGEVPISIS